MGSSCHQGIIGIGFEPSSEVSEASFLGCCMIKNILGIILRVIEHHVFIREVDWQMIDRGPFKMHCKLKDAPCSLSGADVSGVKIYLDFIHWSWHLQCSTVISLVDILADVFDRLDRSTDFKIDVAVEFHQELWGVRNNIFVGEDSVILLDGATIVRSCILWIAILLHQCLGTKKLWKMLLAKSIL